MVEFEIALRAWKTFFGFIMKTTPFKAHTRFSWSELALCAQGIRNGSTISF
ncbi:3763_t:CDS:2 [Entrophospora sp. SA101]|nr:3763_t:CDS:2 [Entrophospora sp. SA101]